jgi:ATP-dependent DNA ligase
MALPIKQPFPPMEAKSVDEIPVGDDWQYEPKWDGFRCLAFRDGEKVFLQSKAGQPLARYFPAIVAALSKVKARRFVLDGELVIPIGRAFSFDELQLRLHPAASRVQKLAAAHPALFVIFDLLADEERKNLTRETLRIRRPALEKFAGANFKTKSAIRLSPATCDLQVAKKMVR